MIEHVTDPDDPRLADYGDLRDGERRRRRGLVVAESRLVVRRLLAAGRFRVRSLLLTEPALAELGDVLARLDGATPVLVAGHAVIKGVVGFDFHRGCLALAERGVGPPPEALLAAGPGPRLVVVCERLAQPDNVGALFRNALAFGAGGVLLSPGSADPLFRKAIRVSLGASLEMPFAHLPDWPAGLARLRAAGFTLLALTPRPDAVDVEELGTRRPVPERVALLVGNEGDGLSSAAVAAADLTLAIPMAAGVDSLNVATAAAIALHRLAACRRRPARASWASG
jgi:tRNA G18 (ribose-2'-O)-methylase SpoU